MKPGNIEMEGDSFQEFSSPAIPFDGVNPSPARPGRCAAEPFQALAECTTVVESPSTDANNLDYVRCKTESLVEIVKSVGDSITPENLIVLQNLALSRRQAIPGDSAEQLVQLLAALQSRGIRS